MQAAVNASFSARAARWTGALAIVSLLTAFVLLIVPGDELRVRSAAADSYSVSALGHRGLVDLLRALGRDVRQRRLNKTTTADHGLLVLAEPGSAVVAADYERLQQGAARTLVVLPKRRGHEDDYKKGWVDRVDALPRERKTRVLEELAEAGQWPSHTEVATVTPTQFLADFDLPQPVFPGDAQLLVDDNRNVQSVVTCSQGLLVGRYDDVFVLTDPDVLANHGLDENAEFLIALLDRIAPGLPITFDETVHGHEREPSLWHAIGSWPLVLVPAQLLLLFGIALWAAHGRFGPVLRTPTAITPGKAFLIDNIAALLGTSRALGPALRRYQTLRLQRTGARLHMPRGLQQKDGWQWLVERSKRTGHHDALVAALATADDPDAGDRTRLHAAQQLYRLTEELR